MNKRYERLDVSSVDLAQLCLWLGLKYNHKKSSARAPVYSGADRHIAVYQKNSNGRRIWVDVKNQSLKGDAFSLVQLIHGCSFIAAKELLIDFMGAGYYSVPVEHISDSQLEQRSINHSRFEYLRGAMSSGVSEYLLQRGISQDTQKVFGQLLRTDRNGTTCMYHVDLSSRPCGYEWKGSTGTGYSKGGTRCLFGLFTGEMSYQYIVVCETAIDAMSFYQIKQTDINNVLIVSTGGHPSQLQIEMIKALMSDQSILICAHDNDTGGNQQVDLLRSRFLGCRVVERRPPLEFNDWNDVVKSE